MIISIIIGDAEGIEAEYGCAPIDGCAVSVVQLWDGDFGDCDGFSTLAAAKAAYEWGTQHDDGHTYTYMLL
jgi:hypothetical protein